MPEAPNWAGLQLAEDSPVRQWKTGGNGWRWRSTAGRPMAFHGHPLTDESHADR